MKEVSIFEFEEGKVYKRVGTGELYKKENNKVYSQCRMSGNWTLQGGVYTEWYIPEPISKPVTAEQVREAVEEWQTRSEEQIHKQEIYGVANFLIKKLGLE